jgi:hypothetical protein
MDRKARTEARKRRIQKNPPAFAVKAAALAKANALQAKRVAVARPATSIDDSRLAKAKPDRKPQHGVTDELISRLERRWEAEKKQQDQKIAQDALQVRWAHKAGTPETHERIEIIPSRRRQHPLERMHQQGKVSDDEMNAAWDIQNVREMLDRAMSISSASLEARVDCSGSARDALVESLGRVRIEVTYSLWRRQLTHPAMILQMICSNLSYAAVAKHYAIDFRKVRKMLISALRLWNSIRLDVKRTLKSDDVREVYGKLGQGTLVAPRPRQKQADDDGKN